MAVTKLASVTLSNFDEGIRSQVEANKDVIDDFLRGVAKQTATNARRTAAFVDKTGNLRRSIRMKKSKFVDGGFIVTATGRGKDKGYHAALVEFGHGIKNSDKRVPPHPFLRPAVEAARDSAKIKIGNGR